MCIRDSAFVAHDLGRETLEEAGIQNCDTVVVCIGEKIDTSILTTLNVVSLGVPNVIAKAISEDQGAVLEKIGAEVIYPERDMALRLAKRLLSSSVLDYISLNSNIEISEIRLSLIHICMCSDVTPMLCGDALVLPALKAAAGPDAEETGLLPARQGGWAGILSAQISGLIAVLCTLFPLDTVLLSGHAAKVRGFVEQVDAQVKQRLSEQAPEVRRADLPHQDLSALLAERIRKNVLCAG